VLGQALFRHAALAAKSSTAVALFGTDGLLSRCSSLMARQNRRVRSDGRQDQNLGGRSIVCARVATDALSLPVRCQLQPRWIVFLISARLGRCKRETTPQGFAGAEAGHRDHWRPDMALRKARCPDIVDGFGQ
jgi:hypothetical protein